MEAVHPSLQCQRSLNVQMQAKIVADPLDLDVSPLIIKVFF